MAKRNDQDPGIVPYDSVTELVKQEQGLIRTEAPYQTAISVQRPRVLQEVRKKLIEEADLCGEEFYYSWKVKTRGGRTETVEGPSIGLMRSAVRLWGNCVWIVTYREDDTHYFIDGHFIDLETGLNTTRPFRQRKTVEIGKYDESRKEDIAFQIGVSKAKRNVAVDAIPIALVKHAMQAAKESAVKRFVEAFKDKKKWNALTEKVIAEFKKLKVDQATVEMAVGPVKTWTPEVVAELSGMAQALRDGYDVNEVFGKANGVSKLSDSEIEESFWKAIGLTTKKDRKAMEAYLDEVDGAMREGKVKIMERAIHEIDTFMAGFRKATGIGEKSNDAPIASQDPEADIPESTTDPFQEESDLSPMEEWLALLQDAKLGDAWMGYKTFAVLDSADKISETVKKAKEIGFQKVIKRLGDWWNLVPSIHKEALMKGEVPELAESIVKIGEKIFGKGDAKYV